MRTPQRTPPEALAVSGAGSESVSEGREARAEVVSAVAAENKALVQERGRSGRLELRARSRLEVRRGGEAGRSRGRSRSVSRVSATWDTALPPTAVMRDGASDSEAPAPRLRVLRPPGRPPGQGHPAAGAPQAGALGEFAPGTTSGSSHPRANRRREGEPCCSEFRLFVRPMSLVFVLTWPLVSWSLHFASLVLTAFGLCLYLCLLLASVFFDPASAPSGCPLAESPNVTPTFGHLSVFFLSFFLSLSQCCVLVSLPTGFV